MTEEESWLPIKEGTLYLKRWTPSSPVSSTPIILLHDSLGCVGLWRTFPAALARTLNRPIIAYDRLGFGQSSARRALPSLRFIEHEAERYFPQIISACLGTLGQHDCYALLGHSVGGAMALNIAANDKRCTAVVTVSAQAYVEQKTLDGIAQAATAFNDPNTFARLEKWHKTKAQWVLDAWTKNWLHPQFRDWKLNTLAAVTCPVFAIHGKQDEYGSTAFAKIILEQCSSFKKKRLLIDQCQHSPHVTHTETVLKALADFFKSEYKTQASTLT